MFSGVRASSAGYKGLIIRHSFSWRISKWFLSAEYQKNTLAFFQFCQYNDPVKVGAKFQSKIATAQSTYQQRAEAMRTAESNAEMPGSAGWQLSLPFID